ncbi:hypothetical protein BJY52DRAFT_1227698 [Lactarius psammicola]|nr:hypothetical protein BJY52DRAFT_1227698 [Lactarius psammicola]
MYVDSAVKSPTCVDSSPKVKSSPLVRTLPAAPRTSRPPRALRVRLSSRLAAPNTELPPPHPGVTTGYWDFTKHRITQASGHGKPTTRRTAWFSYFKALPCSFTHGGVRNVEAAIKLCRDAYLAANVTGSPSCSMSQSDSFMLKSACRAYFERRRSPFVRGSCVARRRTPGPSRRKEGGEACEYEKKLGRQARSMSTFGNASADDFVPKFRTHWFFGQRKSNIYGVGRQINNLTTIKAGTFSDVQNPGQAELECSRRGKEAGSYLGFREVRGDALKSPGTLYHAAREALVGPRATERQGIFATRTYTAQGGAVTVNPFSHHLLEHPPIP